VVVPEQKIETTQEAGRDADDCNQKKHYSGHGLSFCRASIGEGKNEERRALAGVLGFAQRVLGSYGAIALSVPLRNPGLGVISP
jgi:hypothetical protein